MSRSRLLILLSLALYMAAVPLVPAATGSGWYKVELIAFERLGDQSLAGEYWPADPGLPGGSNVVTLQPAGAGEPVPFERLPRKDYELGPHIWSLSRERSGVRPLMHRVWIQPIGSERGAHSVYLRSSGSVDLDDGESGGVVPGGSAARMEGTVRLSRSRYLHARLDLLLRRPGAAIETGAPAVRTFRLQATRRMRSGELHYIDHPAMGMLIKITPMGPAAEEQPADAAGDLPTGT